MLKYNNFNVTFSEIPDEVCLYITITECPIRCPDCNSKWLWEDKGIDLDRDFLYNIISINKGVSCIVFGGGDKEPYYLSSLFYWIKTKFPELKTAWYSGREKLENKECLKYLDYLKLGPYKKERGPLISPNTNQRLYKIIHTPVPSTILVDITHKFWGNEISST